MAKWSAEMNELLLVPFDRPNPTLRPDLNLIKNAKIIGSSEVEEVEDRKSKAEEGESFDPAGRAFVAKVVAAIAELLLPGSTHVTLTLNVKHFSLRGAAAKYQTVIVIKFGEAGLKTVVLHAVLKFASGVLVIALDHLWVLLRNH